MGILSILRPKKDKRLPKSSKNSELNLRRKNFIQKYSVKDIDQSAPALVENITEFYSQESSPQETPLYYLLSDLLQELKVENPEVINSAFPGPQCTRIIKGIVTEADCSTEFAVITTPNNDIKSIIIPSEGLIQHEPIKGGERYRHYFRSIFR